MSTKYLVIGDLHAKPDNLDKINEIFDICEDVGLPVILLGDLLDTKELVRGSCLNVYLTRIAKSKLKYYVLVGNHDWFNLECQDHSLKALGLLKNVILVDKPTKVDNILMIPYYRDFPQLDTKGCDILVGHLDIKGFDYGNGYISEEGLSKQDLKDWKLVLTGHYHKYQKVNNVTYLGTPFSHSFGESNQQKYIAVLDSQTAEMELINTEFEKHVTIEVDCDSQQELTKIPKNSKVRVILKGSQENIAKFKKVGDIKYIESPTSVAAKTDGVEWDSPEKQFTTWAKERKLSKLSKQLGLEILKDVR